MDNTPSTKVTLAQYLNIDQPVSMVDTEIEISAHNLEPYQKITVVAQIEEGSVRYISHAHFVADKEGVVSLTNHPSLGGTYTGINSMGMLWSMRPSSEQRVGSFLLKRMANTPYVIKLGFVNGFKDVKNWLDIKDEVHCEKCIERWYLATDTRQIKVHAGRVRGTLFTPKGEGKHPGIIDLFGSAGGNIEFKAALLASYGYSTLALPYFGYEDLPDSLSFDYEYFDEAVQFMLSHQCVDSDQDLAVIGVSKGAEIALHIASYNLRIKVCVSINGYHFYYSGHCFYKGAIIKAPFLDKKKIIYTAEGAMCGEAFQDLGDADLIPLQNSQAHFLLLQGKDDMVVPYDHVLELADRIWKSGNKNCVVKIYPGAGHMLDPPFTPLCRSVYHKWRGEPILCGGDVRLHATAQQSSWTEILKFLYQHFHNNYKRIGRIPSSQL